MASNPSLMASDLERNHTFEAECADIAQDDAELCRSVSITRRSAGQALRPGLSLALFASLVAFLVYRDSGRWSRLKETPSAPKLAGAELASEVSLSSTEQDNDGKLSQAKLRMLVMHPEHAPLEQPEEPRFATMEEDPSSWTPQWMPEQRREHNSVELKKQRKELLRWLEQIPEPK
jgi:hypothetical protein